MKPISTWLVWLTTAFLWVLATLLWVGIFASIMYGIASYDYPVGTLARDYYEGRK
jgi:hypothetical protein